MASIAPGAGNGNVTFKSVMTDVGDDYISGLLSEGIELATGESNILIDQLTGLLVGQTHGDLTPGHVSSQVVDIDTPNGSRVVANAVDDINVKQMVPDVEVSGVDLPNGKVDVKTEIEGGKYSGDLMSEKEAARYSEYWRKMGIGSDKTWNEFIEANPNRTIDDYFEIVQKQSPWPIGETGVSITLKAGDRFFMVVENDAPENMIGGFGVKERIESTDFVRNNLAVKYEWKTSCNVIREFEVNSGIELNVNAGPVGPQVDLGADIYMPGDTTITQYDLFSNLESGIIREDYVHIIDEYWVD